MDLDKAETRRLLNLLDTFLRMLGISRREAERRLGIKHSAVTRLFKGHIEPKLELILGVVRVIGLEHGEFFALAYPEGRTFEPQSDAGRYLHTMLQELYPGGFRAAQPGEAPAAPLPEAPDAEPVDPLEAVQDIRKTMRDVISKLQAGEEILRRATEAS